MTVLDIGCGGGFASLGLAQLVGEKGVVILADVQPQMLDIVQERATRVGGLMTVLLRDRPYRA